MNAAKLPATSVALAPVPAPWTMPLAEAGWTTEEVRPNGAWYKVAFCYTESLSPMLLIPCPWCGPRDEIEFRYGGEAHIARPADPDALDDAAWTDYLYMRANQKGMLAERWVHQHGCRRWFNLLRDTISHRIVRSYRIGARSG
jgi:sarcosine oxidase subunit delta